ncbi:Beta-catenin-like protein 1-like protein [Exophiala dermatitidis]
MTSVDELFRGTSAGSKRKLEDPTTAFSHALSNKSSKVTNGSSPRSLTIDNHDSNGSGNAAASVQDGTLDGQDDIEAGPSLPPEGVEDEPGDDEEGRFFGGGVSKQEREVIDYIDKNDDGDAEEKFDSAWLRRTAINFERKINKNAELRAKYENDPMKFVGSEADLDAEIKGLSVLSEHGELYKEFVKMGCVGSLVGLLAHENTDIAIAVCELLAELTDEDAATNEDQWKILVEAMLQHDLVDLLSSNLTRLDEDNNESDRAGVYHILNVLENILSDARNQGIVGANDKMMQWLLARIKKVDPYARAKVGQNRQYAAEILAILLQSNRANRDRLAQKEGVDMFLELLSTYARRDPEKDSDEEEYAENLFDCLACVVEERLGGEKLVEGEGVELCLIMLREGRLAKARALRVLDHAMSGGNAIVVSMRLVEAAGLKTVFGMLMKSQKMERSLVEHLIGILASLLRYLPGGSAARIRTLAKFVENDYEKILRLVELRREYKTRLSKVEASIRREREQISDAEAEALADGWLSRRLDAGLFSLQAIELILSWMVAEDNGARQTIAVLLGEDGLKILERSLRDQIEGMDHSQSDEAKATEEMLEALLLCVEQ